MRSPAVFLPAALLTLAAAMACPVASAQSPSPRPSGGSIDTTRPASGAANGATPSGSDAALNTGSNGASARSSNGNQIGGSSAGTGSDAAASTGNDSLGKGYASPNVPKNGRPDAPQSSSASRKD